MLFETHWSECELGSFRPVLYPHMYLIAAGVLSRRFLKEIPKKFREIISIDKGEVEARIMKVVGAKRPQKEDYATDDEVFLSEVNNGFYRS